eukprot:TRINITY_DN94255_c0_g1_i1.p1 TRINITY_DN94255_c0_g1~~TRINITY_DN94255_c0_g1_i1.p1  ORF type:complete len:221 (+),score=10.60 TRINITY_DN94255_c0_g1_i1:21-683(+)
MVFCPECGTLLLDVAKFCTECGTPIQYTPQRSPPQPQRATQSPVRQSLSRGALGNLAGAGLARSVPSAGTASRSPVRSSARSPQRGAVRRGLAGTATFASREYHDSAGNLQLHGFRELQNGPLKRSPQNLVDNPFDPRVGSGAVNGKVNLDEKSNFCSAGNPMYVPHYARVGVHAVKLAQAEHQGIGVRDLMYRPTTAGQLDPRSNATSSDNPLHRPAFT